MIMFNQPGQMEPSQLFLFIRPNSTSTFLQKSKSFASIALGWGLMAGCAAVFFVERIPNFRKDFFSLLPLERYAEYRVKTEGEEE